MKTINVWHLNDGQWALELEWTGYLGINQSARTAASFVVKWSRSLNPRYPPRPVKINFPPPGIVLDLEGKTLHALVAVPPEAQEELLNELMKEAT